MEIARSVELVECKLGKFVLDPEAQAVVIWKRIDNPQIHADIIKRKKGQFYFCNIEGKGWESWSGLPDSSLTEVLNIYEIIPKEDIENAN